MTTVATLSGASPVSIAVASVGAVDQLYITTTTFKVMTANLSSTPAVATLYCGTGVSGSADGHCSAAQFGALGDVVNHAGVLIVADTGNGVLRSIDTASGTPLLPCLSVASPLVQQ